MAIRRDKKRPFGALRGPHLFVVYGAGMVTVFVGERILGGEGTSRYATSATGGGLCLLASLGWLSAWWRSTGLARSVERLAALLSLVGLAALGIYLASSDIVNGPAPVVRSGEGGVGLRQILSVLWPMVLVCSVVPLLFVQWSAASMAKGEGVEPFRAAASARAGATTAALLCTLFLVNAIASREDIHADLSYFKTAQPSESTRDLVAAMNEKTEAILFFPAVSEVLGAVKPYFESLEGVSEQLQIKVTDPALAPDIASKYRVTADGTVVIARGTNSEKLELGDSMDSAARKLRTLDAEFQKMVLRLTVERKTVYVITGHGERPDEKSSEDTRSSLSALSSILKSSNMTVKPLGPVEGLAGGVPGDAAVVIWTDPTLALFPGEAEALEKYLESGGRLLLTLDPASDPGLDGLLGFLGLEYSRAKLANDKAYIPITRTAADKYNLVTASFSSHPSVGSFSSKQQLVPVLFPGTGSLKKAAGTKRQITFTVRAPAGTWPDTDGDGVRGKEETAGTFNLAAAISAKTSKEKKPKESISDDMRVVVLADTDLISDEYLGFRIGYSGRPGNLQLLADALEWLVGQGQVAGVTEGEEDVRIAHTRDEDVFWFYATIFAVPLLILGIGAATRWGRGRKRRRG
jgi:hypothetical protein